MWLVARVEEDVGSMFHERLSQAAFRKPTQIGEFEALQKEKYFYHTHLIFMMPVRKVPDLGIPGNHMLCFLYCFLLGH